MSTPVNSMRPEEARAWYRNRMKVQLMGVNQVDLAHYPHKCPLCGADAYIGAVRDIDCSSTTCTYHR